MSVVATPQDADAQPVTGRLTFFDNSVDTSTDTIKLKATFDNKDRRLWPGQFARISLRLATLKDALVVPSQTVQTGQDGQFVFVVKDNTVEQRVVTTAQRADQDTVITNGLKLGETVVVEGQLRLESGTRITMADGKRGAGRQPPPRGGAAAAAAAAGRAAGVAGNSGRRRSQRESISEIFIRRPIATSLLMAAIALFGVVAYRALPVSDLPQVDYPTLNVSASLPGGDPNTMASAVASPLERQFTTIAGVDSMTSSSGTGNANITLQFDLGRNIDSAAVDVQTAISAALPLLPNTMTSPPSFRKNNPNDQPILMLNITSTTVPLRRPR